MSIVFIHGLGQNSSSWAQTLSYLREQQQIECPDLFILLRGKEATYVNLYKSFVDFCDSIDEPLDLCGLSLGGILALNYAIDYPHKVKSIALIGIQYEMPKLLLKFQNKIFKFLPNSTFEEIGLKKSDFIQLTNSMLNLHFTDQLMAISCKALIVCGEKDYVNKKASKKIAELIPAAVLQLIPRAGHEVNVQAPKALAEILEDFLRTRG